MKNEFVVLVNLLKMEPSKQATVIEMLEASTRDVISRLQGWVSTRLIAASDGASVVIYSEWRSQEDIAMMRSDARLVAYFPKIRELATLESMHGHVVLSEAS
jgi:hypothetical protein